MNPQARTIRASNLVSARELARHSLNRLHLGGVLDRRRVSAGLEVGHLRLDNRREVFSHIYTHRVWRNGDGSAALDDSLSGFGSDLSRTRQLRERLSSAIGTLAPSSVLDVGCGDFGWMQHVDLHGADYTGIDIVPSVVDRNVLEYADAKRTFRCLDGVTEPLPSAELILCREVLFHLSFADGTRLLDRFARSTAKWVLLTTDNSTRFNADISTGDYRVLNLRRRPFRLPTPASWIDDSEHIAGRAIGVWSIDELRRAFGVHPADSGVPSLP